MKRITPCFMLLFISLLCSCAENSSNEPQVNQLSTTPSVPAIDDVLYTTDLNRNAIEESVIVKEIFHDEDPSVLIGYCVEVWEESILLWSDSAYFLHAGETSYFLCVLNNEDYIFQYTPYSQMGNAQYDYKLFDLSGNQETIAKEDSVEFDYLDSGDTNIYDNFSPSAIASFIDDVNCLLANSTEIVSTLDYTFSYTDDGVLMDSLLWLERFSNTYKWTPTETMLENLTRFYQYNI